LRSPPSPAISGAPRQHGAARPPTNQAQSSALPERGAPEDGTKVFCFECYRQDKVRKLCEHAGKLQILTQVADQAFLV